MRKSKAYLWFLVLCSCVSCSLPVIRTGSATAEFALSGAISPAVFVKGQGSRAVSPATAVVEVQVSGSNGILRTVSSSVQPGKNLVRVPNLPTGFALRFEIRTRNIRGDIITKASIPSVKLAPGANRLSAVLEPEKSVVQSFTVPGAMGPEASFVPVSNVHLDYNETKFFSIVFPGTYTGERHIFFDTGSTDWVWLSVYDENWLPLSTVTAVPEDGWVVVDIPATGSIVNIMVANALLSPGYTAAGVTGSLVLQKAVFFAPGASGTGISANPKAFTAGSFDADCKDKSCFFAAGDYDCGSVSVQMSSTSRYYLYGGFSADWKTRGNTTRLYNADTTQITVVSIGPNSGYSPNVLIDGLTIEKHALTIGGYGYAIYASNGTRLRLYRCVLRGNKNETTINSGSLVKSSAVVFEGTYLEVGLSTLQGGYASTSLMVSADSYGLEILGVNAPVILVHSSVIARGYAYTPSTSNTATACGIKYLASNAKLGVSRSRIWGGTSSGGTGASSIGISAVPSGSPHGLLIASSQIASGLAISGTSATITTGVGSFSSSFLYVLCNVIDTGNPFATGGGRRAMALRADGSITNFNNYINGNLFIATANNDMGQAIFDNGYAAAFSENNTNFNSAFQRLGEVKANVHVSGVGFAFLPRYAGSPADNIANLAYSITDGGSFTYDTIFEQFTLFPTTGTYDARLKAWLQGNVWKLTGTAAGLAANTVTIIPFSSIQTYFPEALPLLMVDLGGSPRPQSGVWRIGAYE